MPYMALVHSFFEALIERPHAPTVVVVRATLATIFCVGTRRLSIIAARINIMYLLTLELAMAWAIDPAKIGRCAIFAPRLDRIIGVDVGIWVIGAWIAEDITVAAYVLAASGTLEADVHTLP